MSYGIFCQLPLLLLDLNMLFLIPEIRYILLNRHLYSYSATIYEFFPKREKPT